MIIISLLFNQCYKSGHFVFIPSPLTQTLLTLLTQKFPSTQNLQENEKRMLDALKALDHVCVKHFTEESFEQNLVARSLLGPSF